MNELKYLSNIVLEIIVYFSSGFLFSVCLLTTRKLFYSLVEYSMSLADSVLMSAEDEKLKQHRILYNLPRVLFFLAGNLVVLGVISMISLFPLYMLFGDALLVGSVLYPASIALNASIIGGSLLPFSVYNFFSRKQAYNETSILLHRTMLNNYHFSKLLFAIEKFFYRKKLKMCNDEFLVITGLARCGTTAVTKILFSSGSFHSLTYRNMPVLMSPNLWKAVNFGGKSKLEERRHGDGIMINKDSVEEFDEYFWKSILGNAYIKEDSLLEHSLSSKEYNEYMNYQSLIRPASRADSIYLSKNNNFMLRYRSLREYNSKFKVVLMYRDPVDHAISLQNQHRKFTYMQDEDPFISEYMEWLGHHEFGLTHKAFKFSSLQKVSSYEKDSLNYWVEQWINYYSNALQYIEDDNIVLVDYMDFLKDPKSTVEQIERKLNAVLSKSAIRKFINPQRELDEAVDPALGERAYAIFNKLRLSKEGKTGNFAQRSKS